MSHQRTEDMLRVVADSFQYITTLAPLVDEAATLIVKRMRAGGKALFCGNGGSAADAQHLASELLGRFNLIRDPLPALALTVDTSALTAIANDFGYAEVFQRQLRGLGKRGDVLVALSTSGNSDNILRCLETARDMGIATIGLTGATGGGMKDLCDLCLCVPASSTPRIQEMHIALGHTLCEIVEVALAGAGP
jgi:D-sedoheptulose 7-phosphate isomerase